LSIEQADTHSVVLTFRYDFRILKQAVDVISDLDELGLDRGKSLLLLPHQCTDVFREEVRVDSVHDVEQVLLVEDLLLAQVWQIHADLRIPQSLLEQSLSCELYHLWHFDHFQLAVSESLLTKSASLSV
jgi:hypothetical protein